MAVLTTGSEIAKLKRSGRILTAAMHAVVKAVRPGITTQALDTIAAQVITSQGSRAAFLGFQGYPATLCTSINQEVVHGVPSRARKLRAGDILGLDLGVVSEGMYTDHAVTVPVGQVAPPAARLIRDTKQSLAAGLQAIKGGTRVGDISAAIENYLAPKGYGIVRQLTGHGLGRAVHEPPSVPNFGAAGTGPKLETGMVLAIEPMVTLGGWTVETGADGWTVVTTDGSLAAHFEDTILVTKSGYELITVYA